MGSLKNAKRLVIIIESTNVQIIVGDMCISKKGTVKRINKIAEVLGKYD